MQLILHQEFDSAFEQAKWKFDDAFQQVLYVIVVNGELLVVKLDQRQLFPGDIWNTLNLKITVFN